MNLPKLMAGHGLAVATRADVLRGVQKLTLADTPRPGLPDSDRWDPPTAVGYFAPPIMMPALRLSQLRLMMRQPSRLETAGLTKRETSAIELFLEHNP